MCTELRGSITATPFDSFAQRGFHRLRRVSHLYAWFRGPLARRLFEHEGGSGGAQSNGTSTAPAASRSVVLSGLRIKQLFGNFFDHGCAAGEAQRGRAARLRVPAARLPSCALVGVL